MEFTVVDHTKCERFRFQMKYKCILHWLGEFHECSCTYINVQGLKPTATIYISSSRRASNLWLPIRIVVVAVAVARCLLLFLFIFCIIVFRQHCHDEVEPFSGLPIIIIIGFTFFFLLSMSVVATRSIPIHWKFIIESTRFLSMEKKYILLSPMVHVKQK